MYPNIKEREKTLFHDELEEELGIYSKKGREERIEDDAMNNWEDAIMQGYEEDFPEQLLEEQEHQWLDEIY